MERRSLEAHSLSLFDVKQEIKDVEATSSTFEILLNCSTGYSRYPCIPVALVVSTNMVEILFQLVVAEAILAAPYLARYETTQVAVIAILPRVTLLAIPAVIDPGGS
jgi:hypothetical protein